MAIRRLVLLLLAVFVLAVLAFAFSLNRLIDAHKGDILAAVQSGLGRPVQVGSISATLLRPGLQLADVEVADDPAFGRDPFLTAAKVSIHIAILPMLDGWLEITRFVIERPTVRVVRGPTGDFNFDSLGHRRTARRSGPSRGPIVLAQGAPAPTIQPGPNRMDFRPAIVALDVDDGRLMYVDQSVTPPSTRVLSQVQARLSDLRLDRQAHGTLRAAADSEVQNIDLEGAFGPESDTGMPITLHGSIGPIARDVPRLDDIDFSGVWHATEFKVDSLNMGAFGGRVALQGTLTFAEDNPVTIGGTAEDLDLRQLGAFRGDDLDVDGKARLQGEMQMRAGTRDFASSLQGQVRFEVRDGVLHRFNLVGDIITRSTQIPGLVDFLSAAVKKKYAALLDGKETRFSKLEATLRVTGETVRTDDAVAEGDDFGATATGAVTFARIADLRGVVRLSPRLSRDVVADVKEARFFEDRDGRISLPFRYRGILGQARPEPDIALLDQLGHGALGDLGNRLRDLFGGF